MHERGKSICFLTVKICAGNLSFNFKASPAGTHWYHSHYGYQRDHGLFGVFIVTESNPNKDEKNIGGEVIMTIGDFYQFPEKFDPDEQGNREIVSILLS